LLGDVFVIVGVVFVVWGLCLLLPTKFLFVWFRYNKVF